MPTYLLTWKPTRWQWENLADAVREVETKGYFDSRWSSGSTKRIVPDDRVFMLRQGSDRPGIMGSGWATSEVFEDTHFDATRPNDIALYINARFDTLIDPDTTEILHREDLYSGHLASVNWNTQASGMSISPEAAAELEARWAAHLLYFGQELVSLPDEVLAPEAYFEGATKQVTVSIYERSPRARQKCIEHYGVRCSVCDFDFEAVYGERGRGFIHVHHLVPLAEIGSEYRLDPIKDLRPVCPNCHAMMHRTAKVLSIATLRKQFE
ncbi:MAG: HNH endonuclease [Chthoniobacteraceae bacterium]